MWVKNLPIPITQTDIELDEAAGGENVGLQMNCGILFWLLIIINYHRKDKTEDGEEPVNYHKNDLPLYNLDEIGEDGWVEVKKILSNQSWEGVAEMKADTTRNDYE